MESRTSKRTAPSRFKARTGSTFMKRIDSDYDGVGSSNFQSMKQSRLIEEQEMEEMEARHL